MSIRWTAALALLALTPTLRAAEPTLRNVNVRGLQIGGTTTITIEGDDLGPNPSLLLAPFGCTQELRKGATDKQATFDISPGHNIPGYYHLRVLTDQGVSQSVVIAVDKLPQLPFAAAVEKLPVALHGSVTGAATATTKFTGTAGQKVMVEVEAQRLGSKLRPVVRINNDKGKQLAWAWGKPELGGDARLEVTLPADGSYTVHIHDEEYAGPAPGFFRLRIGHWDAVERVYPAAVAGGKQHKLTVQATTGTFALETDIPAAAGALPLHWPREGLWSGPRPFVLVSPHVELLRPDDARVFDLPAGPVGVSGKLAKPYEEHRYKIPVTPGAKVRFEVFAERYGWPLDAALVIRNEKGDQLARVDDSPGTLDPVLEYAVPDKVTSLLVDVVDAQGRGGPRGMYRLVIEPPPGPGAKGDFRLTTPVQRLSLPVGGRYVVPVFVQRHGYGGAIALTADLPGGVKLDGATIPAEAEGALVTVQRGESPCSAAVVAVTGKADDGQTRTAVVRGHPLEMLQPWLATEIAVAPAAAKAAEFQIDWVDAKPDAGLVPAKKLALKVKLTRPADASTVRLTLLTSQNVPLVNNQPADPAKAIRLDKVIELPAKTTETELTVLVPVELASPVYDLTVQAELLAADKKVKAVAFAPVRRLPVRPVLVVKLDGPERVEVAADPKKETTVKLTGQVERREGLKGDVAIAVTGLPPGARADAVTVKDGQAAFTVNVVLPAGVAPGEKALKVSASAAEPSMPGARVKSRDVDLTVVVK